MLLAVACISTGQHKLIRLFEESQGDRDHGKDNLLAWDSRGAC